MRSLELAIFWRIQRTFFAVSYIRKNCCLWQIVCKPLFISFRKTQVFLRKSSFVIVCKQWQIVCSGLKEYHANAQPGKSQCRDGKDTKLCKTDTLDTRNVLSMWWNFAKYKMDPLCCVEDRKLSYVAEYWRIAANANGTFRNGNCATCHCVQRNAAPLFEQRTLTVIVIIKGSADFLKNFCWFCF